MKSKYNIVESKYGFVVEGKDRCKTEVSVVNHNNLPTFIIDGYHINLIQYRLLIEMVAKNLFSEWKNPKDESKRVPKWIINKCCMAINKRVHQQWQRLLLICDQNVVNIQRKVFSVHGNLPYPLGYFPGVYQHKYFTNDLLNLRSACASIIYICLNGNKEIRHFLYQDSEFSLKRNAVKPEEWMKIYSCEDNVYPALGRTLNNLPGGIPVKSLINLSKIKLKRPLLTRLELCLNLAATKMFEDRGISNGIHIYHFATRDQIISATKKVGNHLRQKFNLRRFSEICRLTQFLNDYPNRHNGNLVGLAEKSIKWHRENANINIQRELDRLKLQGNTNTKLPPIELPKNKGVKFLSTVQEVLEEGKEMNHCVGSYSSRAIKGSCFLFHVDYNGEMATVEVSGGNVSQVYGPKNSNNKACEYAKRVLGNWVKDLKQPINNYVDEVCPF